MNSEQAAHARAMTKKIHTHLSTMVGMMRSIEVTSDSDYESIPAHLIVDMFTTRLDGLYDEIKSVVADMLPVLKEGDL